MNFLDALKQSRLDLLRLYNAKVDGEDAWFILLVDKTQLYRYQKDVNSGRPIDLPDYGKVLHRGWGKAPPQDVIEKLQNEYL